MESCNFWASPVKGLMFNMDTESETACSRRIEFYVDRKEVGPSGTYVIGRCFEGPIIVGDRLTSVYALGSDRITNDGKLALRVDHVDVWPGYNTDQIERGYTGRLRLVGNGFEAIKEGISVLMGSGHAVDHRQSK